MNLQARIPIRLNAITPRLQTVKLAVGQLTKSFSVVLRRPTTRAPLAWDDSSSLRVSIVLVIDGQEYRCEGGTTGGIRVGRDGQEIGEYRLLYSPPVVMRPDGVRRIGETRRTECAAYLIFERIRGTVETELLFAETTEAPPPVWASHNSVAFDAATDGVEIGGDGVLSITHTATGSNRAAFAGNGNGDLTPAASTSITYAGTSMTEMWDLPAFATHFRQAGYQLAGAAVLTGAQTVTSTLAAASAEHALAVITMTGVDSSTPVGTPVTATGTVSPGSVTVESVGADDLVVDNLYLGMTDPLTPVGTVGSDQTLRNAEPVDAYEWLGQSTQAGTAGGVMSWTWTQTTTGWGLGAVAFKAVLTPSYEQSVFRFRNDDGGLQAP